MHTRFLPLILSMVFAAALLSCSVSPRIEYVALKASIKVGEDEPQVSEQKVDVDVDTVIHSGDVYRIMVRPEVQSATNVKLYVTVMNAESSAFEHMNSFDAAVGQEITYAYDNCPGERQGCVEQGKHLKSFTIGVIPAKLLTRTAAAGNPTQSVVLGKVTKAESLHDRTNCPEESEFQISCGESWVRLKISVTRHLSGPATPRVLVAARVQHERTGGTAQETSLFVIEPIRDGAQRRKFGASYELVEYMRPEYCHRKPLTAYGADKSVYYEDWRHEGCFAAAASGATNARANKTARKRETCI
jgi:hypothetical protein